VEENKQRQGESSGKAEIQEKKRLLDMAKQTTLVIGKNGTLGRALYERLGGDATGRHDFNLKDNPVFPPEKYDVVYIVAAKTKFRDCELDEDAYQTNVDGPIRLGAYFRKSFIVYISSEAAEWSRTSYGIQKAHAELGLLAVLGYERLAIVRPTKITQDRLISLVEFLVKIGEERLCGTHRYR